jgi:hypothetical protein
MKDGWLIPVELVGIMAGDFGRELNRWSQFECKIQVLIP